MKLKSPNNLYRDKFVAGLLKAWDSQEDFWLDNYTNPDAKASDNNLDIIDLDDNDGEAKNRPPRDLIEWYSRNKHRFTLEQKRIMNNGNFSKLDDDVEQAIRELLENELRYINKPTSEHVRTLRKFFDNNEDTLPEPILKKFDSGEIESAAFFELLNDIPREKDYAHISR